MLYNRCYKSTFHLQITVPKIGNIWPQQYPPGLILLKDFLTEDEEITLLESINWNVTAEDVKGTPYYCKFDKPNAYSSCFYI